MQSNFLVAILHVPIKYYRTDYESPSPLISRQSHTINNSIFTLAETDRKEEREIKLRC